MKYTENDAQKLTAQLNQHIEALRDFAGLGPGMKKLDDFEQLERSVLNGGIRRGATKFGFIKWYETRTQLRKAILIRAKNVGVDVDDAERVADQAINWKTKITPSRFVDIHPGDNITQTPELGRYVRISGYHQINYLTTNRGGRFGLGIREFKDIGEVFGDLRKVHEELKKLLQELPSLSLETGRAIAFNGQHGGLSLVPPQKWTEPPVVSLKEADCFLLTCELPAGLSPNAETHARDAKKKIDMAIDLLDDLYQCDEMKGKRPNKTDVCAVLQDIFGLSANVVQNTVWKNAKIVDWKKRGRPIADTHISLNDIRGLMEELKKQRG